MSLEKRLIELSHKNPLGSATMTILEHQQIVTDYGAEPNMVAEYLDYKYTVAKEQHQPLGFLLWYIDIHKTKTEPLDYHHRAQENKLTRFHTPCSHPAPHKIHQFP